MRIDRNTYESIFIDFLDGQLSDENIKSLISFLDQNPDLEEELKDLTAFRKSQTNEVNEIHSFNSDSLKKEPILTDEDSNFEELCIAFYEGLLNEKEEFHLIELTENNEALKKTFKSYSHTIAKSDLSIAYPNKKSLKRHKKIGIYQYASYAASILFIVSFIFIMNGNDAEQMNNSTQYTSNTNSYMDYPKVDLLKHQPHTTSSVPAEEKLAEVKQTQLAVASVLSNTKIPETKNVSVNYDLEQIEDFNENSPLSYSRNGKLSYSNLTELELHLQKIFKEKSINKASIQDEFSNSSDINMDDAQQDIRPRNNAIQLATSFNPLQHQKQILGSQPIK